MGDKLRYLGYVVRCAERESHILSPLEPVGSMLQSLLEVPGDFLMGDFSSILEDAVYFTAVTYYKAKNFSCRHPDLVAQTAACFR